MTLGSLWKPMVGCIVLVLFLMSGGFASATEDQPGARQFTLPNGMRVVLCEKRDIPIVNICAAVDLGLKDEPDGAEGLLHLLEHCVLFRGNIDRTTTKGIRENGAYFNAHTGPDLMTFEITLPADRAAFGLRNQKDILFNFQLTPEDLEKEKAIVLEELRTIEDDPRRRAMAIVLENLFRGHPYGKRPAGKTEGVSGMNVEQILEFMRTGFLPEKTSLAVVGDFSLDFMESMVRETFGDISNTTESSRVQVVGMAGPIGKTMKFRENMDLKESYLVIGFPAPDYNHADQYAFDLLTEILGRGPHPLLSSSGGRRRDLIQSVSVSYSAFRFGGVFLMAFTLEARNVIAATQEILSFLSDVRNVRFSKTDHLGPARFEAFDFLESAKNRIHLNSRLARESGLRFAGSLARHLLLADPGQKSSKSYLNNIDDVTSSDLRKVAAKYLTQGECVIVAVVPKSDS